MAEVVFKNLESMLPEFEDFDRLGLFTPSETRKIIKRRTDYEYKLQKRVVEKKDFLKYMEYELNVDCLRRKRMQHMGVKQKHTASSFGISKRLHSIFQKALRKFGSDVRLWMQYIDYCKQTDSVRLLGKSFGRLLQLHPHKPSIWILAAKWELEDNGSVENARSLMQRALRLNAESPELWKECFRLELLHVDKIKKRRALLGIEGIGLEPELEAVTEEFLNYKTAHIVHRQVAEKFPDNVNLRLALASICRDFNETEQLQDDIYGRLIEDFPCEEYVKHAVARRCVDAILHKHRTAPASVNDADWLQADVMAQKAYRACVASLSTPVMWHYYLSTFLDLAKVSRYEMEAARRINLVLEIFDSASAANCVSLEMYLAWAELLLKIGDSEQAATLLTGAVQKFPSSDELRFKRLVLMSSDKATTWETLSQEFHQLSSTVSKEKSKEFWDWWIEICCEKGPQQATQAFEAAIANAHMSHYDVTPRYLSWSFVNKGLNGARRLYKRLLAERSPSSDFIKTCLDMEVQQPDCDDFRARRLYDIAVKEFGNTDVDIWIEYIEFENNLASYVWCKSEANAVYWRAVKQLDSGLVDDFVTKHARMTTPRNEKEPNEDDHAVGEGNEK